MADLNTVLPGLRGEVDELLAAAERKADSWTAPRAPGKWSPSQVVEHLAITLEESAKVAAGAPSRFSQPPSFIRAILRALIFKRVLKNEAFPKSRTPKVLDPLLGPPTIAEGRARLEGALTSFDRECRARAASSRDIDTPAFGTVALGDFARFQELHVRHHRKQI